MLLEKLIQKQNGESDYKFAERLGISHQLWQMVRTGKREIPRPPILSGVLKAYPDLIDDVLFFLASDVIISSLTYGKTTTAPERPQDGKRALFRRLSRVWHWLKN